MRLVDRWKVTVVYVVFVTVVCWGAWTVDQANAARVDRIRTAVLIKCQSNPLSQRSFFD